jgi:hypothetical protein
MRYEDMHDRDVEESHENSLALKTFGKGTVNTCFANASFEVHSSENNSSLNIRQP